MTTQASESVDIYHFGYGSNLDLQDWTRYWDALGRRAPVLEPVGPAVLPDHELAFDYFSRSRGGGALNIRPRVGQVVEGYLFRVTEAGWRGLDLKEGVAAGCYERFETLALCSVTGRAVPVVTYRACADRTGEFHRPTDPYLEACRRGRKRFGLGMAMLEALAAGRVPECEVRGVFAYGTLMRGESRFPIVEKFGLKCALLASTFGDLHDRGAWPSLSLPECADGRIVHGEFLIAHDLPGLLKTLDLIEGFNGFDAPPRLFRRTLINVDVDHGRIRQAWGYVMDAPQDHSNLVPSGCWRRHRARHKKFVAALVDGHAEGIPDFARRVAMAITPPACAFEAEKHDLTMEQVLDEVIYGEIAERRLAQVSDRWDIAPTCDY